MKKLMMLGLTGAAMALALIAEAGLGSDFPGRDPLDSEASPVVPDVGGLADRIKGCDNIKQVPVREGLIVEGVRPSGDRLLIAVVVNAKAGAQYKIMGGSTQDSFSVEICRSPIVETSGELVFADICKDSSLVFFDVLIVEDSDVADIHYRWKAQGGGFLDPVTQVPLDNEKVYLFDANVCSPSNLVENAKGGAPLVGQSYILAKVMTDGVIVAGDVFPYNVEAVGVVWNAYMATELERNGKRYVYVSPEVEVMGLDLGFAADIAFNNQAEYSGSVRDSESHVGPGWYEVGTMYDEICPGKGTAEAEVSAADGNAAISRVRVVTPDPAIISDADYAKYFKLTVEPSTDGKFLVRAELDAEAIDLDKTVASFAAQLADLAKKGGMTVTVKIDCKPGLSYRVLSATTVTAKDNEYTEGETTPLATGAKTEVKVEVPEGERAFFKVEATE